MVLMAGMDLPLRAIREQIASAFDLIVHLDRLSDGTRQVTADHRGAGDGRGRHRHAGHLPLRPDRACVTVMCRATSPATGIRPKFMDKIESYGVYLSPSIFAPSKERGRR